VFRQEDILALVDMVPLRNSMASSMQEEEGTHRSNSMGSIPHSKDIRSMNSSSMVMAVAVVDMPPLINSNMAAVTEPAMEVLRAWLLQAPPPMALMLEVMVVATVILVVTMVVGAAVAVAAAIVAAVVMVAIDVATVVFMVVAATVVGMAITATTRRSTRTRKIKKTGATSTTSITSAGAATVVEAAAQIATEKAHRSSELSMGVLEHE